MTRFKAVFANSADLKETEVGEIHALAASNLREAEYEALKLTRPLGANLIKVLDEGRVARRTWLPLNA